MISAKAFAGVVREYVQAWAQEHGFDPQDPPMESLEVDRGSLHVDFSRSGTLRLAQIEALMEEVERFACDTGIGPDTLQVDSLRLDLPKGEFELGATVHRRNDLLFTLSGAISKPWDEDWTIGIEHDVVPGANR